MEMPVELKMSTKFGIWQFNRDNVYYIRGKIQS